MFPKVNPQQMQKMMKQLGMKQEEIPAEEVIIKCHDKELIIRNPSVQKVNMMGQESIQITGDIEERALEKPSQATPSPPLLKGGNSHPNIKTLGKFELLILF